MCRVLYVVLLPSGRFTCHKFCLPRASYFLGGMGVFPWKLFLNTGLLSSKMP